MHFSLFSSYILFGLSDFSSFYWTRAQFVLWHWVIVLHRVKLHILRFKDSPEICTFFFFTPLQFLHIQPKVTSRYLAFNIQLTTRETHFHCSEHLNTWLLPVVQYPLLCFFLERFREWSPLLSPRMMPITLNVATTAAVLASMNMNKTVWDFFFCVFYRRILFKKFLLNYPYTTSKTWMIAKQQIIAYMWHKMLVYDI